jgi:ATP/maltotriose-dependent transcriptional regulator MalT
MKNSLLIILVVLFVFSCKKSTNLDLVEGVKLNKIDSLNLVTRIRELSNYSNEDSIVMLSEVILTDYPNQKAESCVNIAHVFYKKANLFLAKKYFNKAANIYKVSGLSQLYAEQLTNIGVLTEVLGDYPEAIDYYLQALSIFDSLGLELKQSYVYNNLGIIYQQIGEKKQSIDYYKKSLQICKSLDRLDLCATKYNNIASVYESFDHNLDSALFYYSKSFELISYDSLDPSNPIILANLANIYIQKNKLLIADSLLTEASKKSHLNKNSEYSILEYKAILAMKQNDYISSENYAKKVIDLAHKNSYKEHELKGLKVLVDCYEKNKQFDLAYKTFKRFHKLKLEIAGGEQQKEVERLNTKHIVEQKNNKIKVLELNKEILAKKTKIWSIIIILIILFLLILLYTFYIQKKHSRLIIKNMQRDISYYINQLHDFEEELYEQELTHKELFLQKVKQFNLTVREEEVLLYISQGLKNTEIAEKMFVSINTVKTHIKNIFVKLDVRNRIEAATKAKAL